MTETESVGTADLLQTTYAARDQAARAWKRNGGRVVGYMCDNVPIELILAAGCLPYRLSGRPDDDLSITREMVDALYPPDLTGRPDFASSMLAQLLSGRLDFLDLLIIPHNRHAIQAMYRELQEVAADNPDLRLPTLHYLDKAWSPYFGADLFDRDAVVRLRDMLRTWSGAEIDDGRLGDAIATVDAGRRLMAAVTAERARTPTRLRGSEALWLYGASTVLAPDAFHRAAQALIDALPDRPPREGLRIFLGGSPLDHDRLYSIIEDLGATVVAEDHCWGARLCDPYPSPATAPIDILADRFHRKPACSIRFPLERTVQASVARAVAAKADAAIHYVLAGDTVQSWETPDEVAALRAKGIPTLHLAEQPYACSPAEALRERIGEFLDTCHAADAGAR